MRIRASALRSLIKESISNVRILKERPWTVEHIFSLSKGKASDSEGLGPDGFAIVLLGESGKTMRVIVDTYWNPQAGDQSGNSLKVEIDGKERASTYVPVKFDTGKKQKILISNSPVQGLIVVSHCEELISVPIVVLAVSNPFNIDEDIQFSIKNLGNGSVDAKLSHFLSL